MGPGIVTFNRRVVAERANWQACNSTGFRRSTGPTMRATSVVSE
jgi:hypothetical protein